MRELFIKIKNLSIITVIVSLLIGVVLIIRPGESLKLVSLLCGITVIALGIAALFSYFTKYKTTVLAVLGVISIIGGIIISVKYQALMSVIVFVFGLFILFSGVVDFFGAIDSKRNDIKSWIVSMALAVVTIIFGLLITVNPFSSVVALTRILGVGLIVYAVMDFISFIQIKKIAQMVITPEIDVDATEYDAD